MSALVEFIRDRHDLFPQLEVSMWLLDLAFLTNLTAKPDKFKPARRDGNKPSLKRLTQWVLLIGN